MTVAQREARRAGAGEVVTQRPQALEARRMVDPPPGACQRSDETAQEPDSDGLPLWDVAEHGKGWDGYLSWWSTLTPTEQNAMCEAPDDGVLPPNWRWPPGEVRCTCGARADSESSALPGLPQCADCADVYTDEAAVTRKVDWAPAPLERLAEEVVEEPEPVVVPHVPRRNWDERGHRGWDMGRARRVA